MTAAPTNRGDLLVYSPLALSFVDDFTGVSPIGYIHPTLSVETKVEKKSGPIYVWQKTGVTGLFTPSGKLVYPNLGRSAKAPKPPPTLYYRVTIDAQYYNPLYPPPVFDPLHPQPAGSPGVGFPVTAYDNATDFTAFTPKPLQTALTLLPKPNYPYDGNSIFLKGKVVGASTNTAIVALVTGVEPFDDTGNTENTKTTRVMADQYGNFLLPLRWGDAKTQTVVTAQDPVSGKSATLNLTYPTDYVPAFLSNTQTIQIPTL